MKYVLYHGGCYDGFGAAWAASKALGMVGVEYLPVGYGQAPPPMEPGGSLWIVDFSYPRDVLEELAKSHKVVVLDHHKTAAEALAGLPLPGVSEAGQLTALFDMERSGAGITWDFFNTLPRPALIDFIEDRDLWRFRLPGSKAIHAVLRSLPFDFGVWDDLAIGLSLPGSTWVAQGETLLRAEAREVEKIARFARPGEMLGHPVIVCNATSHWSELGHYLCEKFRGPPPFAMADFSVTFWQRNDGVWQFSLRSIGDFDVSVIAKKFGGGGHKNAAGFQVKALHEAGILYL